MNESVRTGSKTQVLNDFIKYLQNEICLLKTKQDISIVSLIPNYPEIFITNTKSNKGELASVNGSSGRWIIGPHGSFKAISGNFRNNPKLTDKLGGIRFGRRQTDIVPVGEHPEAGFKKAIAKNKTYQQSNWSDNKDSSLKKKFENTRIHKGKDKNSWKFRNNWESRKTDKYEEAKNWFNAISLESHHIVECDTFIKYIKEKKKIELTRKDFEDFAPAVLIKGELHKGLFTPRGKGRKDVKNDPNELIKFYNNMYFEDEFEKLRDTSEKILSKLFKF